MFYYKLVCTAFSKVKTKRRKSKRRSSFQHLPQGFSTKATPCFFWGDYTLFSPDISLSSKCTSISLSDKVSLSENFKIEISELKSQLFASTHPNIIINLLGLLKITTHINSFITTSVSSKISRQTPREITWPQLLMYTLLKCSNVVMMEPRGQVQRFYQHDAVGLALQN